MGDTAGIKAMEPEPIFKMGALIIKEGLEGADYKFLALAERNYWCEGATWQSISLWSGQCE